MRAQSVFAPGAFFHDDFEDGSVNDNDPVTWQRGTWQAADSFVQEGNVVIENTQGSAFLGPAFPNNDWMGYDNVSVRTQVRVIDSDGPNLVSLASRTPNNSHYALVYRPNDGLVRLQEYFSNNDPPAETKVAIETSLDASQTDINMRLDLMGNQIRGWIWEADTPMPTEPIGQFTDDTISDGTIGFWVWSENPATYEFRDFEAIELFRPVGPVGATGQLTLHGQQSNVVYGAALGTQPGLLQRWYSISNPRSYDNTLNRVFDPQAVDESEVPDIPAFQTDATWWSGNRAPISGLPTYPAALVGAEQTYAGDQTTWASTNNDDYTTFLTGEILIPESGTYQFLDGVDDLAVLGIDVDRDGFLDGEELLIDDNAWTDPIRDQNDGGLPGDSIPAISFEDVAAAGEWFPIQIVVGERGGADSGLFYWDYDALDADGDGVRIGDAAGFPSAPNGEGRTIAEADIPSLLIPQSHLRAEGGVKIIDGVTTVSLDSEILGYEFEIGADGADSLIVNRPDDSLSTRLNLNGTTIAISELDGSASGQYQLLVADEIVGDATIIVPDNLKATYDVSNLLTDGILSIASRISFDCDDNGIMNLQDVNCAGPEALPGALAALGLTQGDANGDGNVGFPDFLLLSANFRRPANYTQGDFDLNGIVEFADFLILSTNFGQSAGAATVPEPAGWSLGVLAIFGLQIHRRR